MPKLFMVLIGCRPKGRNTEQHDVFFGIAETVKDLLPEIVQFWPEAKGNLHIDGWRIVNQVDGQLVTVIPKEEKVEPNTQQLFFINLGGYKPGEFEEFHYKMIVAAPGKNEAIKRSKQTAFFKHTGYIGAVAHIDDKYGVDVDDIADIREILSHATREKYSLLITPAGGLFAEDNVELGYFPLSSFE